MRETIWWEVYLFEATSSDSLSRSLTQLISSLYKVVLKLSIYFCMAHLFHSFFFLRALLELERLLSKDGFFDLQASDECSHLEMSFVHTLLWEWKTTVLWELISNQLLLNVLFNKSPHYIYLIMKPRGREQCEMKLRRHEQRERGDR
jgi:hypothetical protein